MPADAHVGACACRACEPDASLRWAVDALLPLLAIRAPVVDPFQTEELAMAAALAASFDAAAAGAKALLLAALAPPVDLRLLEDALTEASLLMRAVVTSALQDSIASAVNRAIVDGATDATTNAAVLDRVASRPVLDDASLAGAPMAGRVSQHAIESVQFYAARYFDAVMVPGLRARVAEFLGSADPLRALDPAALAAIIERSFTARGYWLMVSNAAVSRAYHYGYLKAAQLAGYRAYRWHAVVDHLTSEVCLTLNGLEFWVADAINLMETAAATDDPEAATKLMPWRNAVNLRGASPSDLRAAGMLVPPAHPHCRSTLVVI